MIIEVLGIEGEQTAALEAALAQALAELGLDGTASVRRVTDPAAIVARGVRRWPGLIVDGAVVCRGGVPSPDELREHLGVAGT